MLDFGFDLKGRDSIAKVTKVMASDMPQATDKGRGLGRSDFIPT